MFFYPTFKTLMTPRIVSEPSDNHPVVDDWVSAVSSAGGTYSVGTVEALNSLVETWEAEGLIESGLSSGLVSSNSVIQYVLPCCGLDSLAARVSLIYRSSMNRVVSVSAANYDTTQKHWLTTASNGLNTNFNPFSYTNDGGFLLIRRNSQPSDSVHGATDGAFTYWGIYPSYSPSNIFARLTANTELNAFVAPSNTVRNILVNLNSSEYVVYSDGVSVASGSVEASAPPNATIKLSATDAFGSIADSQPISFIAASVKGIPTNKVGVLNTSINTFRSAL